MIAFGIVIFGGIGYAWADHAWQMGWLGAVLGVALVFLIAFLDMMDNN